MCFREGVYVKERDRKTETVCVWCFSSCSLVDSEVMQQPNVTCQCVVSGVQARHNYLPACPSAACFALIKTLKYVSDHKMV